MFASLLHCREVRHMLCKYTQNTLLHHEAELHPSNLQHQYCHRNANEHRKWDEALHLQKHCFSLLFWGSTSVNTEPWRDGITRNAQNRQIFPLHRSKRISDEATLEVSMSVELHHHFNARSKILRPTSMTQGSSKTPTAERSWSRSKKITSGILSYDYCGVQAHRCDICAAAAVAAPAAQQQPVHAARHLVLTSPIDGRMWSATVNTFKLPWNVKWVTPAWFFLSK